MTWMRRTGFLCGLVLVLGAWQSVSAAESLSFTQDQVAAGRADYREHCASCHGPRLEGEHVSPPLVGARFDQSWRGKSAGVLAFHLRRMPPEPIDAPGGLGDETYANILAHILDANGLETGDEVLPSDLAALDELTIPAPTRIVHIDNGRVYEEELECESLGLVRASFDQLEETTLDEAARIFRAILSGEETGPRRDMVLINAAATLLVGGAVESLGDGLERARGVIANQAALQTLIKLIAISNQ